MNTVDVLRRLTHISSYAFGNSAYVTAAKPVRSLPFPTVRYCVLPWDVLIHYTHKSTQHSALLAILNILTSFHLLDQSFARNSHFIKHNNYNN